MIDITISQSLKETWPEITLGCIEAQIAVTESSELLWSDITNYCTELKQEVSIEGLASLPRIFSGRKLYKKLGKAPSKYRLSSEALIRRVLQDKGVYRINNIVEINNLISLKSKFPVGSYDIDNLSSPIALTVGKPGEEYKGIGKEKINIENLPVLADSLGSFGSPTSDSERAMITDNVKHLLMCIFSFSDKSDLENYLVYGKELLQKYANGYNIEFRIVD